jgi:hypothetical protein
MHLGTQENSLCSSGSVGLGCCEYLWKSWWVEVGLLVSGTDTHRDSRMLNNWTQEEGEWWVGGRWLGLCFL